MAQIIVENGDKYLAQALRWSKYSLQIFSNSVAVASCDDTFFKDLTIHQQRSAEINLRLTQHTVCHLWWWWCFWWYLWCWRRRQWQWLGRQWWLVWALTMLTGVSLACPDFSQCAKNVQISQFSFSLPQNSWTLFQDCFRYYQPKIS